jgi:Holliday junction resolvase RusA-like endonuclease
MTFLYQFIVGDAAAKGSKSFKGMFTDKQGRQRARMVESSKKVAPWSQTVIAGLLGDDGRPKAVFPGATRLTLEFVMTRPGYMDKPKKPKPTPRHTKKPDMDKLIRCVKDAITKSACWRDDSCACEYGPMVKRYAEPGEPIGVMIMIEHLPEPEEEISIGKTEKQKPAKRAGRGNGQRRGRARAAQPAGDGSQYFV